MACDKYRISCEQCDFCAMQDRCPGVNFWNEICGYEKIDESKIVTQTPEKKKFGKLFTSLQAFLPELNLQRLSSNKVSLLKRTDITLLLKAIRLKNKELVPPDYINLSNEKMSKLLYSIMISIHENRQL